MTDDTTTGAQPTTPGWKTTEFWSVVATSVVTILNKAFGWNIPSETIATVAGMVATYAIGRSLVKKA
jgi:Mg2+/Co2+ transporter CorB